MLTDNEKQIIIEALGEWSRPSAQERFSTYIAAFASDVGTQTEQEQQAKEHLERIEFYRKAVATYIVAKLLGMEPEAESIDMDVWGDALK